MLTSMDISLIIRLISYTVLLVLAVTYPLRSKKLLSKCGNLVVELPRKKSNKLVLVFILAILMVVIQRFRSFEIYIHIILSLCAILGLEIVMRDAVCRKLNGVYENALIVDSRFLLFSSIAALPTLEYENDPDSTDYEDSFAQDAAETAAKTLQIVTNNAGAIFVGFDSAEDRDKAVAAILEKEERLRP